MAPVDAATLQPHAATISALCENYFAHRFDLLGSGWVQVRYGMSCAGIETIRFPPHAAVSPDREGAWLESRLNRANLAQARRLWRLVSPDYAPIDWQIDFKSGYRWSESVPSRRCAFGRVPGADVKVPWELARLQHLPHLAHGYRLAAAGESGFRPAQCYAREFMDQALDFMATNPPRFGINWWSAMDVAIRVANLVVAHDVFMCGGASFPEAFEHALARSVREHAAHIWAHLSWHPVHRGNHYLCELAGLAFATAYLPGDGETEHWLDSACRGVVAEAKAQFHDDGGSMEASTGYHRLSAETIVYAGALMRATSREPDSDFFLRVAGFAGFIAGTARPDGLAPQVGDQDSGRFFKMVPLHAALDAREARRRYRNLESYVGLGDGERFPDEELRDHRHVIAAAAALVAPTPAWPVSWDLERALVASMAGKAPMVVRLPEATRAFGDRRHGEALLERLSRLPQSQRARYVFPFGEEHRSSAAYPHFGLFVIRGGDSYVCVRCGPVGNQGLGAHAHNDALSLELVTQGRDVVVDPGSYVYTPLPAERNRYRSVRAHFAPLVGRREPGDLQRGVFALGDEARPRCVFFDADGFLGQHRGYGRLVHRSLRFDGDCLVVEDFSEGDALEPIAQPSPERPHRPLLISPKYGAQLR